MCSGDTATPSSIDSLTGLRDALSGLAGGLRTEALAGHEALAGLDVAIEIERLAAGIKLRLAAPAAETGAWKDAGERTVGHWLAAKTGTAISAGIRLAETSGHLGALPVVADALARGALSEAQATVIADAAVADPTAESQLVDAATVEDLRGLKERCRAVKAAAKPDDTEARHRETHCRRHFRGWADDDGGHVTGLFTLDKLARLTALLQPFIDIELRRARTEGRREPFDAYAADALIAMAEAATGAPAPTATKRPVHVVTNLRIDLSAFLRGHTEAGETCEIPGFGPVSVRLARQMMHDSILRLIVHDGIDVRTVVTHTRHIRKALRIAVEERHQCCAVPGCSQRIRLEKDHIDLYSHTHETSARNLDQLCHYHHRQKTIDGYRLTGRPTDPHRRWLKPQRTPGDPP